jgi:hypothetical protein
MRKYVRLTIFLMTHLLQFLKYQYNFMNDYVEDYKKYLLIFYDINTLKSCTVLHTFVKELFTSNLLWS